MKIFCYTLSIFSLFLFTQCSGKPDRPDSVLNETQKVYDGTDLTTPVATPPATAEPAQNADGVWHYTCSNGCAGGAGSALPCATCGSVLIHNTVYHSGANAAPPADAIGGASNKITFDPSNPGAGTGGLPAGAIDISSANATAPSNAVAPSTPEPPQNAAGVWHYTCSNGCAGGAGSAAPCGTCGNTLAHNSAYHQ